MTEENGFLVEYEHIYCAKLEANDQLVRGHRVFNKNDISWESIEGLLNTERSVLLNIKKDTVKRCEHNCHLCKHESLGRCLGRHYGKDVSVDDMPVCDGYEYGGSAEHLAEIEAPSFEPSEI